MKFIYLVLLVLGLLIISVFKCKSSKSNTKANMEWIKIGNGGGFTGKESVFTIDTKTGAIESEGKSFKNIKSTDLLQWINNYHSLGMDQININEPGNMYQFIELNIQGKLQKLVWNPSDPNVPSNIQLIYDHLNHLIQKASK